MATHLFFWVDFDGGVGRGALLAAKALHNNYLMWLHPFWGLFVARVFGGERDHEPSTGRGVSVS